MTDEFKAVFYDQTKPNVAKKDIAFLSQPEARKARDFHASFDCYKETPLVELKNLASSLGVKTIYVKDESYRFGLNAFKVLGGSYALGCYIAKKLGEDISKLPSTRMLSPEIKSKLGEVTFVTATDGNHGRGVAWTANKLGQHSVVYMPKGSAKERLDNILAEGSDASITELNYDEAVRLANKNAETKGWIMVQDTAWEGYTDIPTWIMQGYTTMGHEIIDQLKKANAELPTHVFLQAGVGSMAGAMAGFFSSIDKNHKPFIAVVEPNTVDCIYRTAEANDGKLHFVTGEINTIMAGLACGEPCTIGWEVLKDYADAFLACPDWAAADGMRVLAAPKKGDQPIVSGESGAAAFGCIFNILNDKAKEDLKKKLHLDENSRILFISTEGDTDKENYANVVWGGKHNRFGH